MAAGQSPAALAALVVARMTPAEKIGELVLTTSGPYENANAGVARLCIPSLTLQDGPSGLAFGDTGVTQLPAPLGLAATFDTTLARQYGEVVGAEARGQGIDVVQGPDLNVDRVPESGRAYESYGEDPFLTTAVGVADIEGIQSQGVLAQAKHLVAYSQETDRGVLDARVSDRTLQEIYLPPFKAAVTQAHVASIMCAYPRLNGTFQCEDPVLTKILGRWGFSGFVRSDLGAVHDPSTALADGTDLLKPASTSELADDLADGTLPQSTVDTDVTQMLTQMFAYGLVGRAAAGAPGTPVDSPAHTAFALTAAERSAVLLKNRSDLLPLDPARLHSVAVIGADASTAPVTTGFGSSQVTAPFTSTPLAALESRLGPAVTVHYADGGSTTRPLPSVPTADLVPDSGVGHGLTLTVGHASGQGASITAVDPATAAVIVSPSAPAALGPDQVHSNPPAARPRRFRGNADGRRALPDIDPAAAGATTIELPAGWSGARVSWTGTLTVPRSGLYAFSLTGSGSASLTLDGVPAVTDTVTHDRGTWSGSIDLVGGHHYQVALGWTPVADPVDVASLLDLGMADVGDPIARAVAAARDAQVAVVFAGDYSAETFDRPDLSLPGDQNALIAAVAAVNPRTVVVLNTGGAVVMPWLDSVDSVLEAWYPGEEDGAAVAALLTGDVDPSGHLPVTFPTSAAASGVTAPAQWPGVDRTSTYREGLDVGYRYDHATGTRPLFPFGFGLSYTTFSFRHATVARTPAGFDVSAVVTDTGDRTGTDVAQAYLTFPATADEPPAQLVAFTPVTLAPGASQTVTLDVPWSAFQCYQGGAWTTVPGIYGIGVGDNAASQPVGVLVPMD
jgi:beta-glucosidase